MKYSVQASASSSWSATEPANFGRWCPVVASETLAFCSGFMAARRDAGGPRLAYRLIREDGKVVQELAGSTEVSIGMIVGFPTAEQYEIAAADALAKAAAIRARAER